ncbi:MAG TPA: hypothetical protein VFK44_09160 [Bacillales bacterium]|nr:hypothetical protein [Bacillales bacterium]
MNWTLILSANGIALAICLFGTIYSLFKASRQRGEHTRMFAFAREHRVMLNPYFLALLFFTIASVLIIGFFSWYFKP